MSCSICTEAVNVELSVRHRGCGHLTHLECLDPNIKATPKLCAGCDNSQPVPVGRKVGAEVIAEPHTTDGINYILNPGVKRGASTLKAVASYIPGISSRVMEDVKTSQNPEFLLANRVPLPTIMKVNKLGLDHFLKAGIQMEDFLKNGYTWKDLQVFEAISRKGAKTALQAITVGLHATANLFRDYPDAFPFEEIKAQTKLQNSDLCELFGLTFPDNAALECYGDNQWNALHCVNLGLTMDDLTDFGLVSKQQYEELYATVPKKMIPTCQKKLQVEQAHLGALIDLEAVIEERVPRQVVQPVYVQKEVQPVFVREKVVHEIPKPHVVQPKQERKYNVPVWQQRQKERIDRHGALLK
jgi:hypothetical protein